MWLNVFLDVDVALRGAATLKARTLKDVWNVAAVAPLDKGAGVVSGVSGGSNGSSSGEFIPEENFLEICGRELLARGCELLKRTRKGKKFALSRIDAYLLVWFSFLSNRTLLIAGDLHWKLVSVYINRMGQVVIKISTIHTLPNCSFLF